MSVGVHDELNRSIASGSSTTLNWTGTKWLRMYRSTSAFGYVTVPMRLQPPQFGLKRSMRTSLLSLRATRRASSTEWPQRMCSFAMARTSCPPASHPCPASRHAPRRAPPYYSPRLHADGAVQPDGFAVQHDVLHDVDGERRVLRRLPEPGR